MKLNFRYLLNSQNLHFYQRGNFSQQFYLLALHIKAKVINELCKFSVPKLPYTLYISLCLYFTLYFNHLLFIHSVFAYLRAGSLSSCLYVSAGLNAMSCLTQSMTTSEVLDESWIVTVRKWQSSKTFSHFPETSTLIHVPNIFPLLFPVYSPPFSPHCSLPWKIDCCGFS